MHRYFTSKSACIFWVPETTLNDLIMISGTGTHTLDISLSESIAVEANDFIGL